MSAEINESTFSQIINQNEIVLIDFWAPWCGPCKAIAPIIEEISSLYEGKAIVGKINVDGSQTLTSQYGIRTIPTLLFFKKGQIVDKHVGGISKESLIQKMNNIIS